MTRNNLLNFAKEIKNVIIEKPYKDTAWKTKKLDLTVEHNDVGFVIEMRYVYLDFEDYKKDKYEVSVGFLMKYSIEKEKMESYLSKEELETTTIMRNAYFSEEEILHFVDELEKEANK